MARREAETARSAAVYARISSDDGSALGVQRQERECRALAKRLGWEVTQAFVDNDASAYNGRRRPAFEELLVALSDGRVNAVLVWHPDRLSRRPRDLERILDVVESRDVAVETVSAGSVDLSTPSGRAVARTLVTWANFESEHKADRIRSASRDRAELGRPHGRRAYGWDRVPLLDEEGRRVGSQDVVNKAESEVVQDIAKRLLAGESVRSVVDHLNNAGVASPDGAEWHPVTARKLVLRERNAGLRISCGEVIGKATWQPILDKATFRKVTALLTDPTRRTAASNAKRHLLTGLARCGRDGCNGRMRAKTISGTPMYCCDTGYCVARRRDWVDDFVTGLVIGRLSRADAASVLPDARSQRDDELVERAALLRAKLDEAAGQYAADVIDAAQLSKISATLRPRLQAVERELAHIPVSEVLAGVRGQSARDVWEELPIGRRREVVDALMDVTVLPMGKRRSREFNPDSVQVAWKAHAK